VVTGSGAQIKTAKNIARRIFDLGEEDNCYLTTIKMVLKLNMLFKFISVGILFVQASWLYQSVKGKQETGSMGVLGCVSKNVVAYHFRIVCSINLQYLKEQVEYVWAFSIGLYGGNNAGTAYLDIGIQYYYKDSLQIFLTRSYTKYPWILVTNVRFSRI
jgi:hypothetical protein